jgi:fructosamine-3-kinase
VGDDPRSGMRLEGAMGPERHPLLGSAVVAAIERAASAHLGRPWLIRGFTDLDARASHPSGVLHGEPFSVFAKLGVGTHAQEQFTAELDGLRLLSRAAAIRTPLPVADGVIGLAAGALLLFQALPERPPEARQSEDWRSIGQALAALHGVRHPRFGLDGARGFFGPLPQDNRPVPANRWPDFYLARRLTPALRTAVGSGHLPADLAAGVERVAARLPDLSGPEPRPSLLHGDAQQNNFISTADGAVAIDPAPYFGHPEIDLAQVDFFHPVPADVLAAYGEAAPLDPGFADRRELWRLPTFLTVIAVDGPSPLGRQCLTRLGEALRRYG